MMLVEKETSRFGSNTLGKVVRKGPTGHSRFPAGRSSKLTESIKDWGCLSSPNLTSGLSATWDDPGSSEVPETSLLREVLQNRRSLYPRP